jgi:hypothetical protein
MPPEEKQFWYALTVVASGLVMIGTTTQNLLGIFLTILGGVWLLYLERKRILGPLVPLYRKYGMPYPVISLIVVILVGAFIGGLLSGGGWLLLNRLATRSQTATPRSSADPDLYGTMATSVKPAQMETFVMLNITIWNRGGSASIVKDWTLYATCGAKSTLIILDAPLCAISDADFSGYGIQEKESKDGIRPGREANYKLTCTVPFSAEDLKVNELRLAMTFFDVMNRPSSIRDS